jgi:hypothetical protein
MPFPQQVLSMLIATSVFLFIVRLVYRRELKEEYSWMWLLTGLLLLALTAWDEPLIRLTHLLQADSPSSVLLFLGFLFLMLLNLQYSIVLTNLTKNLRSITQEAALLQTRLDQLEKDIHERRDP